MFEKVNPSHPDKVADRIAGAIVDLCYTKSKDPKVACEVLIGHGECNIQVETSEQISAEDIAAIVRRIAGEGIETRALIVPQDPHLAANQQQGLRAGDNGIFRGAPPTHEQKLLTAIAASIYDRHPYDGKYIIQGKGRLADPVFDLTVCQSHLSREQEPQLREHLKNAYGIHLPTINPLGPWTGGPNTDSGATNRKLGSDMGDGVTGGGINGQGLVEVRCQREHCLLSEGRTFRAGGHRHLLHRRRGRDFSVCQRQDRDDALPRRGGAGAALHPDRLQRLV